jgi:hypothetical protein
VGRFADEALPFPAMKLEGERWCTLVSTVQLGRDEYRVVRPARPLTHAPMYLSEPGALMSVDKASARQLAMAWAFAIRSPRTLVYLPLRHNQCACRGYGTEALQDLVLMHDRLAFPASRWKDVRARLGPGRPHTVRTQGLAEVDCASHEGEALRHHVAADTVFISGSRKAFALEGNALRTLVEECPRHMHENPGTHCCAEISVGEEGDWLHVIYCAEHRVHL